MAFQGSLKELPLPDIIQLVSVSGKTGVFTLHQGSSSGEIYLLDGNIVHATTASLEGEEAVYELAVWSDGEFVFHPGKAAPSTTIKRSNTNLLMEAARRIDEWQVLSKRIPSTSQVPVFTDQAKKSSVSLTPGEWNLISKIDERRTIEDVASTLGESPFEVCKLLYGLITSGLVSLVRGLEGTDFDRLRQRTVEELEELAQHIHQAAEGMLEGNPRARELEKPYRIATAALASGKHSEALLDLIRADAKVISAGLGQEREDAFSDWAVQILNT